MDWAARFIDSIYNGVGNNIYVNEHLHSLPTVMSKRQVEMFSSHIKKTPIYDEIRKTVRFK